MAPSVALARVVLGRVSAAHEVEQGGVDLAGVGPGDGVRAALDDDQLQVVDQSGQPLPVLSIGSTWSASPWMTSIGTSILGRSARKSVVHVLMQATVAVAEAVTAKFQLACQAWS